MDNKTAIVASPDVLGIQLGSCAKCGHIQKTRTIDSSILSEHFFDRWLERREDRSFVANPIPIETIRPYLAGKKKILEIGCGSGQNLKPFLDCGYKVFGVDPSRSEIEVGKQYGIPNLEVGTGEGYLSKTTDVFDVIFLFNVVQFLNDPFFVLNECMKRLKDGGVLYTSNGDFWDINIASTAHFAFIQNYPTEPSLLRWAKNNSHTILPHKSRQQTLILQKTGGSKPIDLPPVPTYCDWARKIDSDLTRRLAWLLGSRKIKLAMGREIHVGHPRQSANGSTQLKFLYQDGLPPAIFK